MEKERGVEAVLVNSETQQYIIIAVGSPVAVNLHSALVWAHGQITRAMQFTLSNRWNWLHMGRLKLN